MIEPVDTTPLFRWPEAAAVGRIVPKERLYSEASVSKRLRQRFIDEIHRIRWAYKLSEESLHLRAANGIDEIQVFQMDLKGTDVSESILTSIDKSVPSPIIFELHRTLAIQEEVQLAAARKEPGARGSKLSGYFRCAWVAGDSARKALPPALDLAGLYSQLLTALVPIPVRPGEGLSGVIDRVTRVRKLEREISALDRRVRLEPQFNRQVELRRHMRSRQAQLIELTDRESSEISAQTDEDTAWRS